MFDTVTDFSAPGLSPGVIDVQRGNDRSFVSLQFLTRVQVTNSNATKGFDYDV